MRARDGTWNTQARPGDTPLSGSMKSISPVRISKAAAGGRVERTRAATGSPLGGKSANSPSRSN